MEPEPGFVYKSTPQVLGLHDLRDPVVISKRFIECKLVVKPQADEHGYGHSSGEAGNINERIALVFGKIDRLVSRFRSGCHPLFVYILSYK